MYFQSKFTNGYQSFSLLKIERAFYRLAVLLVAVVLLAPSIVGSAIAAEFTVGVVPQFEAKKLHSTWQPILDALSLKTGHTFKLMGSKTIPEFESSLQKGEFDIIYANPWHAVIANETQGYVPIIKDGKKKLKGILVVRKDSGINEVSQLDGQEVAFPAPNALGASLLMSADLQNLFGVQVVPIYVKTHTSVYLNVVLGDASAGGGVRGTFMELPNKMSDALRVLYETRPMNPHPICVHPRLSDEDRVTIQRAFLDLGEDLATNSLFSEVPIDLPERASIDDYLILKSWGLRDFYVSE